LLQCIDITLHHTRPGRAIGFNRSRSGFVDDDEARGKVRAVFLVFLAVDADVRANVIAPGDFLEPSPGRARKTRSAVWFVRLAPAKDGY
jgi:hypothetical protein